MTADDTDIMNMKRAVADFEYYTKFYAEDPWFKKRINELGYTILKPGQVVAERFCKCHGYKKCPMDGSFELNEVKV